jgi:RNA polymerase sigma-70 factor (ECF subfamily)
MHDLSDAQLMSRVAGSDPDAFDALAERYEKAITLRLRDIIRDSDADRDLTQEVLLRVWTHADQWDGRGSLNGWILRIATNTALNHLRTVRRRRESPLEFSAEEQDYEADTSALRPEEAVELAERNRLFRQLVEELPADKQEVLRLVHESGMEVQEVAEALGVPEGTVKSRLHYARKRLAREWRNLEREWEES